jgi:purine-nucleoside phosphorylase
MLTPHNEARKGDFAEAVLLPGDPARSEWVAKTFFEGARLVNTLRGELGYTGTWRGMPVSIQATGMGRPSLGIYVHELLQVYGARRIIRIGTCGAIDPSVPLRAVIVAERAFMDFDTHNPDAWKRPDPGLLGIAARRLAAGSVPHHIAPMVCSDVFYHPDPLGRFLPAREKGALTCEMESSALYAMADQFGVRALSMCTVVDSLVTFEEIAPSERQAVFGPMAELALDTLLEDAAGA